MQMRNQLLVAAVVLLLVTLACGITGTENEVETAWTEYQNCINLELTARPRRLDEPETYRLCFPSISAKELELIKGHEDCLVDPNCSIYIEDTLDWKQTQTADSPDQQAPQDDTCSGLSNEECANAGTHLYDIVRYPGPSSDDCRYQDWPPSKEPREIRFEDNNVYFRHFLETESYFGHKRVAENVFEWTNPENNDSMTVTFLADGFSEDLLSLDGACRWHIEHTLAN